MYISQDYKLYPISKREDVCLEIYYYFFHELNLIVDDIDLILVHVRCRLFIMERQNRLNK